MIIITDVELTLGGITACSLQPTTRYYNIEHNNNIIRVHGPLPHYNIALEIVRVDVISTKSFEAPRRRAVSSTYPPRNIA